MTIEDIVVLAKKGMVEEALKRVEALGDPFDKVLAVVGIAKVVGDLAFLQDAAYLLKKVKKKGEKAIAYSEVALAHSLLGDMEKATELFNEALRIVEGLEPKGAGPVAGIIASRLALAGFIDAALETFEFAFDTIMNLEVDFSKKIDMILQLADLMEETGDDLTSEEALPIYLRAHDIFEKLRVNQRAGTLEKKIELARVLKRGGWPDIRHPVYEGKYQQALHLIQLVLTGENKAIAILEMALWAKRSMAPERYGLLGRALDELSKTEVSQEGAYEATLLLTELRKINLALKFALSLEDTEKRDIAIKGIIEALIEDEEYEDAKKLVSYISDERLREEVIEKIMLAEGQRL
ncbi:hypothetical protein [Pyrococcus yayanosii]|uniref:Uncharacterized protein n=1 Tax=Pyrococcus yayanosii (strain CH1 / JCM 16557) TaxID=529709 RepID=F8AET7_PYRYC|nr:hypothetical protein [Pyrococcus yayanosii]AEH24769.1 hypothetical protein PYCH_10880 [Pyrococcus yayanosii CH1]